MASATIGGGRLGVQSPAETLHDGLSVLIESSPYACKYTNFILLHLPAIQKPFP